MNFILHRMLQRVAPRPMLQRVARRLSSKAVAAPSPSINILATPIPLVAFGVGIWLSNEPERPARVRAHMEAAARALRLASTCVLIAKDYRAARSWAEDDEGDDIRALSEEHNRMQQVAGRAERARAKAQTEGTAAELLEATAEARRTRETAMAMGEKVAVLRLERAGSTGLASKWEDLHQKSAERFLSLCIANGGAYVKIGQHLAQLDYIVPKPYTRTLAKLFEHNAPTPYEEVVRVVESETGRPLHESFASFEPTPIASASLAQVHRAYELGTDRPLAVKVQHPRLREASKSDMLAVSLAVRAAEWLFGKEDFRLGWIVDELAPHLPLELDFVHERQNLERCRDFFEKSASSSLRQRVALPEVLPHLSSHRMLTMTFESGCSVTDKAALIEKGLSPASVTRLLSEAFCSLIFEGGFVHCDPHPGNVLVRPMPNDPTEPQLVLLDHGLYRELPTRFTLLYAQLWHALVLGDADGIRQVSFELGVGEYYPLLAAMLTNRPWGDVVGSASSSRLKERNTAADKEQIRGYAQQYLKQIVHVLERVPRPMLLLFKTNDCLRHAERQLDAGVDSFLITLRYCLQAMLTHDRKDDRSKLPMGLRARWHKRWHRLRLRVAHLLLRALTEGAGAARAVQALLV